MATNLLSGEPVVLSRGDAAQKIVASTAIPAALAPVRFEERYLADGAITNCRSSNRRDRPDRLVHDLAADQGRA